VEAIDPAGSGGRRIRTRAATEHAVGVGLAFVAVGRVVYPDRRDRPFRRDQRIHQRAPGGSRERHAGFGGDRPPTAGRPAPDRAATDAVLGVGMAHHERRVGVAAEIAGVDRRLDRDAELVAGNGERVAGLAATGVGIRSGRPTDPGGDKGRSQPQPPRAVLRDLGLDAPDHLYLRPDRDGDDARGVHLFRLDRIGS